MLLLLTLVGILTSTSDLSGGARTLVRTGLALAPILMPAGFFFSVLRPGDDRPNRLIALVYLGALSLAASAVTLGLSSPRGVAGSRAGADGPEHRRVVGLRRRLTRRNQ